MVALAAPAAAQQLTDGALIEALRRGGYNIYFRHAETDWSDGDQVEHAGDWTSCDTAKMRQLSDMGRATARRLGNAIRALGIPVGKVLSSEYCRAVETARLMRLGPVETTRDIMNMRAADLVGGREAVIRRAQRVLSTRPPAGANVIIVGHGNLMRAATDAYPQEGGSGIYAPSPQSDRGFELVSRLSSEDWSRLAKEFAMPN
ncbi:MAG: histidine phosphatase family protein [Alphaproteobacteria bacterium]|nr:histidine phosphatase family protein [Alphaproteobacteria bacterium]